MKIFKCNICGSQHFVVNDSGIIAICCGEEMEMIQAKEKDEAFEKHVPVVMVDGSVVRVIVGEVPHPMIKEHFIQWIGLEQGNRTQFVKLEPGNEPKAVFHIDQGFGFSVYEHCNIHGMWKAVGR